MTTPALDDDLDRLLEQARDRQYDRVGRVSLLWLALVPEWTDDLAHDCGFPLGDGQELSDFISRASQAGLCDSRLGMGRASTRRTFFHMPDSAREDFLSASRARNRREVAATAIDVAERVLAARTRIEIPLAVEHWAELAVGARGTPGVMGESVTRRVRELTRDDDTGAALDWLAAAEGLAPIFGGEIASAVSRGKQRVNLEYRRRQDERVLARFVRREEQISAIVQLLDGPDDQWALHLIGMGGVGKTMLIRYVGSLLAREQGRDPFPVGRIDFDHINPRFPFERPTQLLVELGDSFAPYAQTAALESALESFVERVRVADEVASGPAQAPLERIASDPVQDALAGFAAFLGQLPPPVLLVLDTCEELAKLHPASTTVPSVQAMWGLLEGLATRVAGLRVLLAGRRLLATEGAGWRYEIASGQPASLASLGSHPYLRLHELRGFDRTEAADLLQETDQLDEELVTAILRESPETGRVPGVPDGSNGTSAARFNPFDLALYADWLREKPDLASDEVAGGETGAYIEARVVRRLHDEAVEAMLPAVALLGRFDAEMLAPLLQGDDRERERVMAFLAEQEWVDISIGEDEASLVIEVEPQLLPRMRRYFATGEYALQTADAIVALGPHLRALLQGELTPLTIDRADAALRLLPAKSAATLWAMLERRVCDGAMWGWAVRACERLLADDEITGAPRHEPIRPHLRATYLAALAHVDSTEPPQAESWALVLDEVSALPDPRIIRWLRNRGAARMLAAAARSGGLDQSAGNPFERAMHDHERRGWWDEQAIAGDLAAIEAILDAGTIRTDQRVASRVAAWVDTLPTEDPELLAGAHLAAARATPWPAARRAYERSEAYALAVESPAHQRWLDWIAPSAMRERVRLWWLLAELRQGDWRRVPHARWLSGALERPPERHAGEPMAERIRTADGERLAALLLELSPALLTPEIVERLAEWGAVLRPAREPECPAHRDSPTLVGPLARGLLATGRMDDAVSLVRRAERQTSAARGVTSAAREAAKQARLLLLWVVRRMRLAEDAPSLLRRIAGARALTSEEQEAVLATEALLLGHRELRPEGARDPHIEWRTATARDHAHHIEVAASLRDAFTSSSGARRVSLALDRWEVALLEGAQPAPDVAAEAGAWRSLVADSDPRSATQWQRLALREWALGGADGPLPVALKESEPRVLGDLALEEGELLALRLPTCACPLFDLAATRLARASDEPGVLIAQIAGMLARFRSGDSAGARRLLDGKLRREYTALQERLPELPEWDNRSGADVPEVWAGWITRLRLGQDWAEGRVDSARRPAELDPGDAITATETAAPVAGPDADPRPGSAFSLLRLGLLARRFGTFRAEIALTADRPVLHVRLVSRERGWVLRESKQSVPAADAPDDSGAAIALLRGGKRGTPQSIPGLRLRVAAPLERYPWEARLLLAAEPPPNLRTLEVWRIPATFDPEVAPTVLGGAPVTVIGPDRWLLLAEEAWSVGGAEEIVSRVADERLTRVHAGDAGILHLVGSPAETSGGWRLRFSERGPQSAGAGRVSSAASDDEVLLAPDAVTSVRSAAIVVQGTPGAALGDGDGLRGFASALVASGAYVVLTIPMLPPAVAARVVTAVGQFLQHETLTAQTAIATAGAARAEVFDGLGATTEAARVALDVCLFIHEEAE